MRMWIAKTLTLCGLLLGAVSASAVTPLSLEDTQRELGPNDCPVLTQVKYPWLTCAVSATGGRTISNATVAPNATWDADKRIPRGHVFVDGQGGWKGPID